MNNLNALIDRRKFSGLNKNQSNELTNLLIFNKIRNEEEISILKNALGAIGSGFGDTKIDLENYAEQALITVDKASNKTE